jgi:hypothetical protein
LVCSGIFLGYLIWIFQNQGEVFQSEGFLVRSLLVLLGIFMILLLDFIIRKNKLTAINTYAILLFGCMMLLIPHHILHRDMISANFFLFLAFRRILSIQSDKNLNKKILDAAIWISVASLFYVWSILYLITLVISILLRKSKKNYRHFLIPVAGVLTVLILVSTYNALFDREVFWFLHLKPVYSINMSAYYNGELSFVAIFMSLAVLLAVLKGVSKYPRVAKKHKPNHIILALILFIGLVITILEANKNGTEFFFLFFPLSILMTNAIETIRTKWMNEVILWSFLIAPAVVFLMN